MSAQSSIEWTDRTWNPVRGCSRVSPGCDNCYAMRVAHRFAGPATSDPSTDESLNKPAGPYHGLTVLRPKTAKRPGVDWSGRVRFVPEALGEPLRWRKPQRVFVNSMSDLFHESLEFQDITRVFAVMAACPSHTFQVLTKRPIRAAEWFAKADLFRIGEQMRALDLPPNGRSYPRTCDNWPLPNLWFGVSVEDRAAKVRIDELRDIPAALRFLSIEPLLEDPGELDLRGIHWVIVGGESGAGARPFHVDWARSIVKQCAAARVACFVKQLGAQPLVEPGRLRHWEWGGEIGRGDTRFEATDPMRESSAPWRVLLVDRKGGDMAEWPKSLRVREFPEPRT